MMNNDFQQSFHDILLNSLCAVLILFVISLFLVSPYKSEDGLKMKAEFIIMTEWDKESNDDVDSYLQDPNGNLVNFQRREDGLMHLDRDDRGKKGDEESQNGEKIVFEENIENISIRAIAPGEYICNVHMYNKRDQGKDTEVTVKIIKLNPTLKTIIVKKVVLKEVGDEETVFRFTVTAEGDVVNINDLGKKFTGQTTYGPENYE